MMSKQETNYKVTNPQEVNTLQYNCGGYALETYNWFLPILTRDSVVDEGEADWLTQNGYETYWDFKEDADNTDEELDKYIEKATEQGEAIILEMLSETGIPENMNEDEAIDEALELYNNHNYKTPIALQIAALSMLKVFPDLRKINNWEELTPNEYGVAYRGGNNDFHFVKYDQLSNTYSHKVGYQPVEEINSLEEGFDNYGYDSDTIYFAKKRAQ